MRMLSSAKLLILALIAYIDWRVAIIIGMIDSLYLIYLLQKENNND